MAEQKKNVMIDLNRVAGPPEPGLHRLRLTAMEAREGQSGFPYLACTYAIEEPSPDNGKTIWDNVSLSPKARFRMEPWLDANDAPDSGQLDPHSFVGNVVWAILDHDEYQGSIKAVIAEYLTEQQASTHVEFSEDFEALEGEMGGMADVYDPSDDVPDPEEEVGHVEEFEDEEFDDVPV